MVAQSSEPWALDKNVLLFTIMLLVTITTFAKKNSELKYKLFLTARLLTTTLLTILYPQNMKIPKSS